MYFHQLKDDKFSPSSVEATTDMRTASFLSVVANGCAKPFKWSSGVLRGTLPQSVVVRRLSGCCGQVAFKPLSLAAGLLFAPALVAANEIGGNHAWQYRSVADRALALQQLDMMMRRNAGGYNNFYNSTHNTYVAGDQVNCSLAATAAGNTGTTSASGSASSPTIGNTPSILAQATGSSLASQGWPSGGAIAPLNATQSNTTSPQSAAVSGTTSRLDVASLQSTGGVMTQALNSAQTNTNSPQTAAVSGSSVCAGR
ncbi:hypothetical protein [Falsiroseomonas sp.]|uniref:hypothetical protein n=1 Tax=Falsiroseomonas sp. TaxID=2870721 RepID=UPI00272975C5|nr:hypothetical protein [Falsiroseomonas sp.]